MLFPLDTVPAQLQHLQTTQKTRALLSPQKVNDGRFSGGVNARSQFYDRSDLQWETCIRMAYAKLINLNVFVRAQFRNGARGYLVLNVRKKYKLGPDDYLAKKKLKTLAVIVVLFHLIAHDYLINSLQLNSDFHCKVQKVSHTYKERNKITRKHCKHVCWSL